MQVSATRSWMARYLNKRILAVFFLGFSSGLPIALIGGTLQAWFKTSGASITKIGFMSLISLPYVYKVFWAPLLDKYKLISFLDRRRGWMLGMQLVIVALIIIMAGLKPEMSINFFQYQIPLLALFGLILSFCSATQDIAIDAYKIEILAHDERGLGSALSIEGYRVAMIASGGFALILADHFGWQITYLIMASLMLIGIFTTLIAPKTIDEHKIQQKNLFAVIQESFGDFLSRKNAWLILVLISIYKLSDALSQSLSTTFLLDLGFSLTKVGSINKVLGIAATLIGVFVGGLYMTRTGLFKALLSFGILAGIANLMYMLLAIVGKNHSLACAAVFVENICAGMGTAAFLALLMSLCNPRYTATQFALFSCLASTARTYAGPIAGYLVKNLGWAKFYLFTAIIAIPALLLLLVLQKDIKHIDVNFKKSKT